jgi:hypothetical protein
VAFNNISGKWQVVIGQGRWTTAPLYDKIPSCAEIKDLKEQETNNISKKHYS